MAALERKALSREEGGRGFENSREQRKRILHYKYYGYGASLECCMDTCAPNAELRCLRMWE